MAELNFPQMLMVRRRARKMGQDVLARIVGVPRTRISKWESPTLGLLPDEGALMLILEALDLKGGEAEELQAAWEQAAKQVSAGCTTSSGRPGTLGPEHLSLAEMFLARLACLSAPERRAIASIIEGVSAMPSTTNSARGGA